MPKLSAKEPGSGKGRQSAQHTIARREGDHEKADALAPPSEKRLTADQRCGARTQGGAGAPCRAAKGSGTDHPGFGYCSKHGGNTPAGVKSAMRSMGREFIERYKREHLRFGGDRNDPTIRDLTPEMVLIEEVRRSAAMVRFLEERIASWNLTPASEDLVDRWVESFQYSPRTPSPLREQMDGLFAELDEDHPENPTSLPNLVVQHDKTGLTGFTDIREWLLLYREERKHLAQVAKMAIDADVSQRVVSIAEDQGRILATALRVVLGALSLSPDQERLVPVIVPQILRAVATDSPIPDVAALLPGPTA